MHDIDRGANTTAARLAALAALRHAQGDGALSDPDAAGEAQADDGRDTLPGHPPLDDPADEADTAHCPGQGVSAGVYAAVEAAVKKSRVEFLARLVEYRRKLDCDGFKSATPESLTRALDEAQFVAHRIAGVGKTLGFADLGDTARQAEAAITAFKLERTTDLRKTAIGRVCKLMGAIETICAEHDCPA